MTKVFAYHAYCSCQRTKLALTLSKPVQQFTPRACDCDFCMARKITYLSDPLGVATISCSQPLEVQKQGSMQAEFLTCPNCEDVLAASMFIENRRLASINATLLLSHEKIAPSEVASPKQLGAQNKVSRWAEIWMPLTVNIEISNL